MRKLTDNQVNEALYKAITGKPTTCNIWDCKATIRPCLILEAIYAKTCIRKYALTEFHPAVKAYLSAYNSMNDEESTILQKIDSQTLFEILNPNAPRY